MNNLRPQNPPKNWMCHTCKKPKKGCGYQSFQYCECKPEEIVPKRKIYIAGKVTGEDLTLCRLKFAAIQKVIEDLGYEVLNPMELVKNPNVHWSVAMRICIMKLMTCHGIFVLKDHILSKGATIEFQLSQDLQMPHFKNINELRKAKWSNSQLTQ